MSCHAVGGACSCSDSFRISCLPVSCETISYSIHRGRSRDRAVRHRSLRFSAVCRFIHHSYDRGLAVSSHNNRCGEVCCRAYRRSIGGFAVRSPNRRCRTIRCSDVCR